MRVIVTGGSGFIGSAIIRRILTTTDWTVVNLDKLGYAAVGDPCPPGFPRHRYALSKTDITDPSAVAEVFRTFDPQMVIHSAAETHVDRSIDSPLTSVATNVMGTAVLLEAIRRQWQGRTARSQLRFHLVSTDEVFGSLPDDSTAFDLNSPLMPNSPYAATKAGADLLVRAYGETYGLPVSITRGSNTLGPWQFPEKLIPLTIANAIEGKPISIYGDGQQRREWLHVDDHARAIILAATSKPAGRCWLIGPGESRSNIEIVHAICDHIDRMRGMGQQGSRRRLIRLVADRPAHDRAYAVDTADADLGLDWRPSRTVETALEETVTWYLENEGWWRRIRATRYAGERLGLTA